MNFQNFGVKEETERGGGWKVEGRGGEERGKRKAETRKAGGEGSEG